MSQERPSFDPLAAQRRTEEESETRETTGAATAVAYTSNQYGQRISEVATQAKDYVSDRVSVVSERIKDSETPSLSDLTDYALAYTRQNPGKAMLCSAALAFFVGQLLQPSERVTEQRFIEPVLEPMFAPTPQVSPAPEAQVAREYIISRPSGFGASPKYDDQLSELASSQAVEILDSLPERGAHLARLTDNEVEQLKARFPGLVIEPNVIYKKCRHPLLESFEVLNLPAAARTKKLRVKVSDDETGRPIKDALVLLFRDLDRPSGFEGTTDRHGKCEIVVPYSRREYAALMVFPQYGYWGRLVPDVAVDNINHIALRALPSSESAFYDWGHKFAEMRDGLEINPKEIKIGIIDTGICKDHPGITPAGGRNFVRGEKTSMWGDNDGHGTHVAGIVAATISKSGKGIKGYAPQARIYSYRAIGEDGAYDWDLAKAIDYAVDQKCDIINMSLGQSRRQDWVEQSIERAYKSGILCIAATGNERGAVYYPAAFKYVMGVGAFGKFGVYPDDSVHLTAETKIKSTDGVYYLASFSNFGDGVDFCAPGVAIVSTVPGGDYCAWDGTSMACPQVTGIAALALAAHPDIFKANRDADRVERLIQVLKSRTRKLNFGSKYEGAGYLTVPSVL